MNNKIFGSKWYLLPEKIKKMIKIMIIMNSKPIKLFYVAGYQANFNTFLQVNNFYLIFEFSEKFSVQMFFQRVFNEVFFNLFALSKFLKKSE